MSWTKAYYVQYGKTTFFLFDFGALSHSVFEFWHFNFKLNGTLQGRNERETLYEGTNRCIFEPNPPELELDCQVDC